MQFLCQNKELTRRGALLYFTVTNKERLVRDVKVRGSFAPNDMVGFRIWRGWSRIPTLDLKKGDFGLFSDTLGRILWDTVLESNEVQESGLIFKVHHLLTEKQFIPTSRRSSKGSMRPVRINKELQM